MPARVAVLRVSPPHSSRGFAAPPELVMDLEAVLDCRVDVVSARGLRDRFRERVLADAVIL
jgi:predicted nucleotidyltransferase